MKNSTTRYLGLDVHKATIAVAYCEAEGTPVSYGTIPNQPSAVRRLVQLLGREATLQVAYEAGATGYALHRQLAELGITCLVVAPSLIPRRPGDRVKTDRRDALSLARLLRSGDLTPVWVPDEETEALRDLVRARFDAKADLLRAKHRLTKFLLRRGITVPAGMRPWGARFDRWLEDLELPDRASSIVLRDYRATVGVALDRVRMLEAELERCAMQTRQAALIAALQTLYGIGFLSAVTIAAESGNLRRFPRARAFMSFTGLTSSEHSSGPTHRRGGITHSGNPYLRHVLVQAAHHSRHQPTQSRALRQRQGGMPADLVELATHAQQRLFRRYRHLMGRLGRAKAVTAVARELAGFVWAVGQRMPLEVPVN